MSIESWKQEFYPVPAEKVPEADALAHSIRKWEGLQEEALRAHALQLDHGDLYRADAPDLEGRPEMVVDGGSCALCHLYSLQEEYEDRCKRCPLALSRGGTPCDQSAPGEPASPWHQFRHANNPAPMLEALQKARAFLLRARRRGKRAAGAKGGGEQ